MKMEQEKKLRGNKIKTSNQGKGWHETTISKVHL